MIRRWRVEPDMEEETSDGMVLTVSQEALAVAVMDAVTMVHRAGGVFQVVCERFPTGLPGEMVTTGAVVEWRSSTTSKEIMHEPTTQQPVARPEPEKPSGQPDLVPNIQRAMTPEEEEITLTAEPPLEDDPSQYRAGEPVDDIGDGIDPNTLPEEDDSEITETVS